MQKYKYVFAALTAVLILSFSIQGTFAKIGVGVGTGKIQVTQKLKPGQIYVLPSITVLNTGDEVGIYTVSVAYHENQPEIMPPKEWFSFEPNGFELEPGKSRVVDIKLNVPLKVTPGDYFAYIEAQPNKKQENGQTSVGVAAASKLYFTISPANFVEGIYFRTISLWKLYEPWTTRGAYIVSGIVLLLLFKKYFRIELNTKSDKKSDTDKNNEKK